MKTDKVYKVFEGSSVSNKQMSIYTFQRVNKIMSQWNNLYIHDKHNHFILKVISSVNLNIYREKDCHENCVKANYLLYLKIIFFWF